MGRQKGSKNVRKGTAGGSRPNSGPIPKALKDFFQQRGMPLPTSNAKRIHKRLMAAEAASSGPPEAASQGEHASSVQGDRIEIHDPNPGANESNGPQVSNRWPLPVLPRPPEFNLDGQEEELSVSVSRCIY